MLMLIPSEMHFSMAGRPSVVPGILIIRLGRLTRCQKSRAPVIEASVSWAMSADTSSDTKPSWWWVASQVGRCTSQAIWTSLMAMCS